MADFTEEQLRAAAKKAFASGDIKAAEELFQQAMALKGSSALTPEQMARLGAVKAGQNIVTPERAAKQKEFDRALMPYQLGIRGGALDALQTGVAQGATFGLMDEIQGAIGAATGNAGAMDAQRLALETSRRDHPVAAIGGEIIGGAITSGAAAKVLGLGGGLTPGARAVEGAKVGAVEGAIYGGASADENRLKGAATGGVIGGAVGGAAPLVAAGVKSAFDKAIAGPVASMRSAPSETRAARAIAEALARSGRSVDDVADDVARAASEGQPMFTTADALGNSGQRMLAGVARSPGDARQTIAEALTARQGGQGNRLASFVAEGLDAPDTAAARVASLKTSRDAAANVAYAAAREGADPVDVRAALSVIDDRIGGMAESGVAGDGIDARLASYKARLSAPKSALPQGVTARELSDFDRVLGVKQQVADDIGAAVRAGRNNEARELGKLKDALDAALEASSAAYRSANDDFASTSRVMGMVDEGSAATSGRVRSEDTLKSLAAMTPEQKAAFAAGYADPIIARIDNAAPGANKARPMLSEKTKAELGALASDPELLSRRVSRENTMFETANTALGGSRTADNLQDIADVSGVDANVLINILTGNWKAAATQIGTKAVNSMSGRNTATRDSIAKALLGNDIKGAIAPAIRAQIKSAGIDAVVEALARSASRAASGN